LQHYASANANKLDIRETPCNKRGPGLTPVRRLEGVAYWVIEDPADIEDYLRTILRKEWEADIEDDGVPARDWLADLLKRKWSLQILDADRVHGSEYLESEALARRRAELRRGIERFGHVIWPIVVWEENLYLADGYCRYTALREMGVSRLYAYVGSAVG
jgi:disulfide oxidoreductase YuzD